jgi:hypothetical protein
LWARNVEYERERVKGFPIPEPFQRLRVYPQLFNYGSIHKTPVDWGMDGTILKSIDFLMKSGDTRVYGPLAWTRGEDRGQVKVAGLALTGFSPNHLEARFDALGRDETVVFNFMHYPGWRAFSGGSERQSTAMDGGFLGVDLKQGDSRVELRFSPTYYFYLLGLSLALILVLLLTPILCSTTYARRRSGSYRPPAPPP